MSDDLRTRIAKAIEIAQFAWDKGDGYNGPEDPEVLADAVIAELGLRQQWDFDGMITYNNFPTSPPGDRQRTRWVTAWGEWQQIQ